MPKAVSADVCCPRGIGCANEFLARSGAADWQSPDLHWRSENPIFRLGELAGLLPSSRNTKQSECLHAIRLPTYIDHG